MREYQIFPEITIKIAERPGISRVPVDDYDDKGNVIGRNPNYEVMCAAVENTFYHEAVATAMLPLPDGRQTPQVMKVVGPTIPYEADMSYARASVIEVMKTIVKSFAMELFKGFESSIKSKEEK